MFKKSNPYDTLFTYNCREVKRVMKFRVDIRQSNCEFKILINLTQFLISRDLCFICAIV